MHGNRKTHKHTHTEWNTHTNTHCVFVYKRSINTSRQAQTHTETNKQTHIHTHIHCLFMTKLCLNQHTQTHRHTVKHTHTQTRMCTEPYGLHQRFKRVNKKLIKVVMSSNGTRTIFLLLLSFSSLRMHVHTHHAHTWKETIVSITLLSCFSVFYDGWDTRAIPWNKHTHNSNPLGSRCA